VAGGQDARLKSPRDAARQAVGAQGRGTVTSMEASTGDRRFYAAGVAFLMAALVAWLALSLVAVTRQGTWPDEAYYILTSWWYVNGTVKPYSAEASTWYPPLIFYMTGAWQWIVGHGVATSRSLTLLITGVNIALMAWLLRRLGSSVWPIAAAIVIFALTEDSIFYFNSVTPYALAIGLQLAALHLLLSMSGRASWKLALALGVLLTAIYLLRINLILFIALALAIAWVRAGRDRWRVYLCSSAVVAITWSLLALLWGRRFIYISTWLPGVTDWLVHIGVLPDFYPNMPAFSSHMLGVVEHKSGLAGYLGYVFGWDMLRNWILAHHAIPVAAALFATIFASVRNIPSRGWTLLFALSYWAMLLYHHLGAQSFCPICIQGYANYFNYLAALAGGLALQGLLWPAAGRIGRVIVVCLSAVMVAVAAVQSWRLTGPHGLPSIRNQADSLPAEIGIAGATLRTLLPRGAVVGMVGVDPRIPLALQEADARLPPIFLTLSSTYRKLNDGLTPEIQARTIAEFNEISAWTDAVARQWIEDDFDWLAVQRQPVAGYPSWLIWTPEAPLITTALEKCFEKVAAPAFANFDPPFAVDLYKRVGRGKVCLGE
jgi:hypothetical protein